MNNNIFLIGRTLCLIIVSFGLVSCSSMGLDLKTGKEARRAGNYDLAEHHLKPLAEFGVDEAKYEYAIVLLRKESSSDEDYQQALTYLQQIRGKRHANALFEIGRIYEKGLGVAQNYALALDYYQQSFDKGYIRAQYQSAGIFEKKKDYKEALALYKKALNAKFAKAAYGIGRLYERGRLGSEDLVAALSWYIYADNMGVSGMAKNIERVKSRLGPQQISKAYEASRRY